MILAVQNFFHDRKYQTQDILELKKSQYTYYCQNFQMNLWK